MARRQVVEDLSIRGTAENLTVSELKPLVRLIHDDVPSRKGDLVDVLTRAMKNPKEIRALYDGLSELNKRAVEEAVHDPMGLLNLRRFGAKYGQSPDFGGSGRFRNERQPTRLSLFFPRCLSLPTDLRDLLLAFVPEPPALTVNGSDDLPERFRRPHKDLGQYYSTPDEEEVDLRVRQTARPALQDVKAVLRLVDAGEVRVGEKTRRPSQVTLNAVGKVLAEGEFYQDGDQSKYSWDPASDLVMKAFAWPMLLQAAGLAQLSGSKLQLSPSGRKATTKPAHEVIRLIWDKWLKTSLLDEFNRINVIKGQQVKGKGGLTALVPRRQSVVAILRELPPQKWISSEEVFRVTKALEDFSVSRDRWRLYIGEQQYGSLGYDAHYTWETLQGRYVLAFLFEYAATLGVVDVAYISPAYARNDFRDRWGTDEFSCLSRYDGLMFVRINTLGAWCLGLAERYEPETAKVAQVLKVLPNLDVAAVAPPLSPADVLLLERFAERQSEDVWHLSTAKTLAAVEEGLTVAELRDFLNAKNQAGLPQTVETFLTDLEQKAGKLEDLGAARLIACADAHLAHLLASDRRLRKLCELAGDCKLVFRAADETAVRRGLRELGYVLPPVF